jgi:hypothetical protein
VKDQVIWAKILTQLRIDDKDSKGRLGRKVHIACVFKCYDRDSTPPLKLDKKARKSHQKHPYRVVGLRQEEEEDEEGENSCSDGDFEDVEEESTLSSGLKRSAISCPSATQNQLHAKHTRESRETEQEKVRTELFCLYQCTEERCSNYRSCCYIYKKNYYIVTPQEQMEWAIAVTLSAGKPIAQRITVDAPLVDWIAAYINGHRLMDMKRTGKRQLAATPAPIKLELETSSQAASSLSEKSIFIHTLQARVTLDGLNIHLMELLKLVPFLFILHLYALQLITRLTHLTNYVLGC